MLLFLIHMWKLIRNNLIEDDYLVCKSYLWALQRKGISIRGTHSASSSQNKYQNLFRQELGLSTEIVSLYTVEISQLTSCRASCTRALALSTPSHRPSNLLGSPRRRASSASSSPSVSVSSSDCQNTEKHFAYQRYTLTYSISI